MTEPIGPLEPGRAYTCRVHLHQSDGQRARALLGRRETRYFGDLCNLIFASAAAQRAGGGGGCSGAASSEPSRGCNSTACCCCRCCRAQWAAAWPALHGGAAGSPQLVMQPRAQLQATQAAAAGVNTRHSQLGASAPPSQAIPSS